MKRPLSHIVWFTLVVASLVISVFEGLGEIAIAFVTAGRVFTNHLFVAGLYVGAVSVSAFAGYRLLPRKEYLTLVRAALWLIYSGFLFSVFHWLTFACITHGFYAIDWLNTIASALCYYGFLGVIALIVWGVQKARGKYSMSAESVNKEHGRLMRKQHSTAIVFVAIVLIAASLFLLFFFQQKDRYSITNSHGMTYRIDKKTGEILLIRGTKMVEVMPPPCTSGSVKLRSAIGNLLSVLSQFPGATVKAKSEDMAALPHVLTDEEMAQALLAYNPSVVQDEAEALLNYKPPARPDLSQRLTQKQDLIDKMTFLQKQTPNDVPDETGLTLQQRRMAIESSRFNELPDADIAPLVQDVEKRYADAVKAEADWQIKAALIMRGELLWYRDGNGLRYSIEPASENTFLADAKTKALVVKRVQFCAAGMHNERRLLYKRESDGSYSDVPESKKDDFIATSKVNGVKFWRVYEKRPNETTIRYVCTKTGEEFPIAQSDEIEFLEEAKTNNRQFSRY